MASRRYAWGVEGQQTLSANPRPVARQLTDSERRTLERRQRHLLTVEARARRDVDAARLARDRLIVELLDAHVSPIAVGRAIGATRNGVYQMAQRAKGAR